MEKGIKKRDCFFQRRKVNGKWQGTILMEVLNAIEDNVDGRGIYKVRWHVIGKDCVHTSEFPMATIADEKFMGFHSIPRELFTECIKIIKNSKDYKNAKRRVVYRLKKTLK